MSTINKGDTIKALATGVKCFGVNGEVVYTSTKKGDVLGVATGPEEADKIGNLLVNFIRYSPFTYGNIVVLYADEELVYGETPSKPVVTGGGGTTSGGSPNPTTGDTPATKPSVEKNADGDTVVKQPGLEDLAVKVEDLRKLIEAGSKAPLVKTVPVWAWVTLGGMFMLGLTLILVNRNRPVPKRR